MEKVKKLLLFGILTLLGIGSSFGYNYVQHFIDFQHNSSNQSYYILGHGSSPIIHFTSSINSLNISPFLRGTSNSLSLSLFSLSTNASFNNIKGAGFYYNSNGNRIVALYTGTQPSSYGSYLVPITSPEGLSISEDLLSNTSWGTYVRVFSTDINCFSTGVFSRTGDFCVPNYLQVFTNNPYTITSQGNVYDSTIDGVNYKKGPVGVSLGMGYSFGFVDGNGRISSGNNHYIDGTFHFKSIMYSGSQLTSLNNVLLYRLDNNTPIDYNSTDNYNVVALALSEVSGYNSLGYPKFPWIYSIYSCPYNSNSIYQCSFVEGGTTDLYFQPGFTSGSPWLNSYFFTYSTGSAKMFNSYNSSNNTLTFYRYYQLPTASFSTGYKTTIFTLDSSEGFNIIDNIPNPDGGSGVSSENPFGIFGGNSLFYHCVVDHTTWDDPYCFNPDGTLKSDEELKSCYYSKYIDMSDGGSEEYVEYYCIDDHGIIQNVAIVLDGSGAIFVPCEDFSCQFKTSFGSLTGYSVDFFDYYLNKTGYFFKCPWPYDNKLTIWPKLITLLNGVDVLLPLNCAFAGFSNGKTSINFENSGHFIQNGPLLNFEGDNRTLLYRFFDIIISLGIVIFVGKIFYLFHK